MDASSAVSFSSTGAAAVCPFFCLPFASVFSLAVAFAFPAVFFFCLDFSVCAISVSPFSLTCVVSASGVAKSSARVSSVFSAAALRFPLVVAFFAFPFLVFLVFGLFSSAAVSSSSCSSVSTSSDVCLKISVFAIFFLAFPLGFVLAKDSKKLYDGRSNVVQVLAKKDFCKLCVC